ncbi:intraflagellar transport protein 43 homolog A [Toxorhynchites rutilus septentrionalis]|uniref:intraflagellar transport protein 43 homolog A n=1 Tax=Toxorhynchites rutilus septentrionalis TaxID=329112 RepID=UPI0024788F6A|nr:intraflagellar transport protein 43 homolog A [Toxorhynchites rutilus septentrionalis]
MSSSSVTTPTKQIKTDSWMDDVLRTSSNSVKNGKNYSNLLEMERFGPTNVSSEETSTIDYNPIDDIPTIPDVDELQENNLHNESLNLPTVTTYKQLSSDIFRQGRSSLGNLDEIDISILTDCLENEEDIEEPDEPWNWDQLFTQLSVKISTETKSSQVEFKN